MWHLLPHIAHAVFHLWGQPKVDLLASSCTSQCQPPLDLSDESCTSFWCVVSPSSVQMSGRTCHSAIQTYDSSDTLLNVCSLSSHDSQHVGRPSSLVFHNTRPHH